MKIRFIVFLCSFLMLFSCSNEEKSILDFEQSEITKRVPPAGPKVISHWVEGEYTQPINMLHGFCVSIGGCYQEWIKVDALGTPIILASGQGIQVEAEVKGDKLHFELLEPHVTLAEIEEAMSGEEDSDQTPEEIYELLSSRVNIAQNLSLGEEMTNALLPDIEDELIIMQAGEYSIDYSESEFGKFSVAITLE